MQERIRSFSRRLEEGAAERLVPFAHGVGIFTDSTPTVYDANYLRVDLVATAEEHAAEAESLMEALWHRRVSAGREGKRIAAGFQSLGWTLSTHLVMAHVHEPDRRVDTSTVREVPLAALAEPHTRATLAEAYGTVELADQLLVARPKGRSRPTASSAATARRPRSRT